MGEFVLSGNPSIQIILRRSARARRISLRLSQLDGRVTLTLPQNIPESEAVAFAREKEDWLRHHLAQQDQAVDVSEGTSLEVEGQELSVRRTSGRGVRQVGDELLVAGDAGRVGKRVQAYLRQRARDRLAAASDAYALALGESYTKLTLRDTRSRWGSCTSDRGLMYSWRLILAPPDILQYVAAHEVAHLQQMNHSAEFWKLVEQLYGDWRTPRTWLRNHGAGLHRYRFGD